jgi:hypothetical protein
MSVLTGRTVRRVPGVICLGFSKSSQSFSVGSSVTVTVTVDPPAERAVFMMVVEGSMGKTASSNTFVSIDLTQIWVEDSTIFEQTLMNKKVNESTAALDVWFGWMGFFYDNNNYSRTRVTMYNGGSAAVTGTVTVRFLRVV